MASPPDGFSIVKRAAILGVLIGLAGSANAVDILSQVFLRDAIQANLAEIQLGKLAQDKVEDTDLQAFAQSIATDDTALNEDAKKVAGQIGMNVPSEPTTTQKDNYTAMMKLSGAAFERAFIKQVIAVYKAYILRFQNEAKKKDDPVADFAQRMLPILQKRLDTAQKLKSPA